MITIIIHQVIINTVDLQLRTADVTSVSAYVTWRFFDAQEKPYIDGVQLRSRTHYLICQVIVSICTDKNLLTDLYI